MREQSLILQEGLVRRNNMPREKFDREINAVFSDLLLLGDIVDKTIAESLIALKNMDNQLAEDIIYQDDFIDRKQIEIEERCYNLIATQQPMASDLRTLVSIIHIAVELERMGDYAEGIAKIAIQLGKERPLKSLIDIPAMADLSRDMLRKSLDALVNRDLIAAQNVLKQDDEVDMLYQRVFKELLGMMNADTDLIKRATYLIWVAHDLERVADRATNVSERVIYLITGKLEN